MKRLTTIAGMTVLLASLAAARAQTTLTAWTFDNLSVGANSSPQPSTGFGAAAALGMGNSYNNTNSISNPQVVSLSGSSSGNPDSWQVSGGGVAPNGGNGWSTSAPIGSQGARFSASTVGYYRIMLSFDVYATPDAEANLQVQYTTDGTIWRNATITSGGTLATIASNSATNQTVMGSYVILTNNGTTGWNNQITVDLSGISGVDNDPAFAVRIVNASAGTNCVDTTGAPYNNVSGNWTFDNVVVSGVSIDTITEWTFDSNGTDSYVPHPVPEFTVGNTSLATSIGFDTTFIFSDGSDGSTNDPDTLVQAGSSTGNNGPICWRVRGQGPGNGWYTASGIGTQGAEFDVSTVDFTNVVVNFDLYFTSQAEVKMMVEYTLDGSTWINATNLAYGANPTFIVTNAPGYPDYSTDTVLGTFFWQTTGQNWYNNLVVDFTGVDGANNNPNFGIRIVNAAQNGDCINYTGGTYNNSSGNCRFDNVTFGGHFVGSLPPAISYAANATVDGPFTNTFTDDPTWRSSITAIYANGVLLPGSAYIATQAGEVIFIPANSPALQASGVINLVYLAAGYNSDKVTQPLLSGVATKLAFTLQPIGPTASGGTLTQNPMLAITDQYGNGSTNPYPNVTVTASVGSGNWTLGGATVQAATNGFITFTNLSATNNTASSISTANMKFTITGYSNGTPVLTSSNFTVGVAPVPFTPGNLAVLQVDMVSNNTTFSMIELKSSVAAQKTPVNIVPISATGTNALRQSSAGSTGRLALSDDGTLLCFAAFADGSSASLDETLVLSRAAASLNYTNQFIVKATYNSTSLGGSQARAACSVDNTNFIVDDKGGLYYGQGFMPLANINNLNNVVVKSFGGTVYVETQKTANGSPIPVVYGLGYNSSDDEYDSTIVNNLGTDPVASDFYLTSTNGGSTYDVMYIMDQVSSSQGIVKKYSRVYDGSPYPTGSWIANGTFTNGTGGDGLFACTNGVGEVYLYYTTGSGGTAGNSVVRLTDASSWNQPINITSSNVLYTASKTTSIKGLTFVPQQIAYTNEVIPTPILTAQTFASTNATFSVTNTPDDPAWRATVTITVNGTVLPAAAYNTNQAGAIVFDPSQSSLLQSPGSKTIVFSATGYVTNSVTQVVAGVPAKLAVTTQPKAPAADGSALATQPVVTVEDASGNTVFSTVTITAAPVQASWVLGGTTAKKAANGVATFSGLTAFSTNSVTGATIQFTASGLTSATSSAFNIPAPVQSILKGTVVNGTNLTFTFTNFTGLSFSVLSTNDITAPLSTWPVVGAAVESPSGSGIYNYTNSAATNSTQFFILRQP